MDDQARLELAEILDALANGDSVQLGEFGDNAESRAADDQAVWLRDHADGLRQSTRT